MPDRVRALRQVLLVLVVFAVAGALAGVVWEWLWTPPTGVALDEQFLLDGDGLRGEFSGTGLYVVVAAVAGLLLGVLVAVLSDRDELVTLVVVAVGSVLAGWLMLRTGVALGPPDPAPLAQGGRRLRPPWSTSSRSPGAARSSRSRRRPARADRRLHRSQPARQRHAGRTAPAPVGSCAERQRAFARLRADIHQQGVATMSSSIPPDGSQQPEYLEQGSGGPIGTDGPRRGNRRTAVIAGGAVVGLLLIGGGTWAALSFFGQGPQPAEALPASTLGYAASTSTPAAGRSSRPSRCCGSSRRSRTRSGSTPTTTSARSSSTRWASRSSATGSTTPTTSSRGSATATPSRRSTSARTQPTIAGRPPGQGRRRSRGRPLGPHGVRWR